MHDFIDNHELILMEAAIVEPIRRGGNVPLSELLVHGGLIYDAPGRSELRALYLRYAEIALAHGVPYLMCTPTWRTNQERVRQSGVDPGINRHAVDFLHELRDELNDPLIRIGGTIGCKNDCYRPDQSLSTVEAEIFHTWQVNELSEAGVDFLFAVTLPAVDEALGISRAMAGTDKPYLISFVINRQGHLLDGTPLPEAIQCIDQSVTRLPLGYMVNCAYPTFLCADKQPKSLYNRLIGFQGNASSLDHSELDCAAELQMDDIADWGAAMVSLHQRQGIKILGGCCGTGADHLRFVVEQRKA